jgi:hypothetical protein
MTEDESEHCVELKDLYVILPPSAGVDMPVLSHYKKAKKVRRGAYCSH